uniref:non-specific serine/threonine protein kinase n=1 Tax=Strigamia maritima TaxID=126957 RepID=T1JEK4_STRMM
MERWSAPISISSSLRVEMPRTYVNNASNRSLGRVGMAHGTAVHSSSGGSSSSNRTYVDNASNRSLGRVGMVHGTAVHSSSGLSPSSTSPSRTYVDNASNRALGRVGLPLGSAVHSSSSNYTSPDIRSSSVSKSPATGGPKFYANNAYNQRLGRVGLPLGSAIHSRQSTGMSASRGQGTQGSGARTYVDNPMNRKLGRVGKIIGTAVVSVQSSTNCRHIDNVFQPLVHIDPEDNDLADALQRIVELQRDKLEDLDYQLKCEKAKGIVHRHEAGISQYRAGLQRPNWVKGGEIIEISDLEIGEKIGGGGFGDVFVAIWKKVHQVAVKKLRVQRVSREKKEQFQKEVQVFSGLSHPAIIEFYAVCPNPPNLAIVMEFMPSGSLYDVLHVEDRRLDTEQKYKMGKDCISAVKYLHSENITHRDIKSMNILVCEDYTHCKLSDFGLALKEETRASASVVDHSIVGTIRYSPPEVLKGDRLTISQFKTADVYSLSILLNELLTRKEPYIGLNQHQVRAAILDGKKPSMEGIPDELGAILAAGLSYSDRTRISASQLYNDWEGYYSLPKSFSRLNTN